MARSYALTVGQRLFLLIMVAMLGLAAGAAAVGRRLASRL